MNFVEIVIDERKHYTSTDDEPRIVVNLPDELPCRHCSDPLVQYAGGVPGFVWQSDHDNSVTCAANNDPADDDATGLHEPVPGPARWCNHASVTIDNDEDTVTVAISVDDPQGAFAMTIQRVPDDADNEHAGRLLLKIPYADMSYPHMPVGQLQPGVFVLGKPLTGG
jgi:hypothetical protein